MSITRRTLLTGSCNALACLLRPRFVWSDQNSSDSIRRRFPNLYQELVVADSTNLLNLSRGRVAAYGNAAPSFDPVKETTFRRDRVIALASMYDISHSYQLSSVDTQAIHNYISSLAQTPAPSLTDDLWNFFSRMAPGRDESLDIVGAGTGISGLYVGLENPYAGAALGAASLLEPFIKQEINHYWPTVRAADDNAVRATVSQFESGGVNPDLAYNLGIVDFFGVPLGSSSDDIFSRCSPRIRDGAKAAMRAADSQPRPDATDMFKSQSDQVVAAVKDLRQSILDEMKVERAHAEELRAHQEYLRGEISSSIYLGSVIIGEMFGATQEARVFSVTGTESLKVWQLVQGFNAVPPTVGSLALTGGFISAGLSIGQAMAGIPSSEQVTQAALANIQSALSTLRQEMHERFDRIERNQQLMMQELDEILRRFVQGNTEQLARLQQMHESLNGLRTDLESQVRQEKIDALKQVFDDQKLATPHLKLHGDQELRSTNSLHNLSEFVNYADRTSLQTVFSHGNLTSWSDTVISDVLKAVPTPDLAIGLLNVSRTNFGLDVIAAEIPNPVEWARGTHVFMESVAPSRKQLPVETHAMVKRLYSDGRNLNDALTKSIDAALCAKVSDEYSKSFDEVRNVVALYYQEACKANSTEYIYAGVFPWLSECVLPGMCSGLRMPPGSMTEQDPVMLTGSDGTFYSGDQVMFARGASIRAIKFEGRNPLNVAMDIGLVDVHPTSSIHTNSGLTTAHQLHDNVILTFKAGKWKDMVTTQGFIGEGIERVVYDEPHPDTWYIYENTKLQLTQNSQVTSSVAIGADVGKFLSDLRDEITAWHSELRKNFLNGLEIYLSQSSSSFAHFTAVGDVGRFLASLIAWGKGASAEDIAHLFSQSQVTLSSPQSLADLTATILADEAKIGPELQEMDAYVGDQLQRLAAETMKALLSGTDPTVDGPLFFQIVEGTLVKLQGLAFHHGISLQ